jgi:hypothetical protein
MDVIDGIHTNVTKGNDEQNINKFINEENINLSCTIDVCEKKPTVVVVKKIRPKNLCSLVTYDDSGNIVTECNERLTLAAQITGKCRCGDAYCSKHRVNHNCTVDYHTMAKKRLAEENPVMAPPKI